MRRVPILMTRELKSYFQSPLAYVLSALCFLLVAVFVGFPSMEYGPKALLPGVISFTIIVMIFMVPILTMHLLSEEKNSGTMEILVTDPVTDWDIVLGKYLAGLLALCGVLLPLGIYVLAFTLMGHGLHAPEVSWFKIWAWLPLSLEWGPIISGFLGLALVGAVFTAVGLLASSLTRSQPISALGTFVMLLVFASLVEVLRTFLDAPKWHELFESLSLFSHLRSFVEGRIDTRSLFLFLSTIGLLLYLTVRVVESRKWR